MKKTKSIKCDE